MACILSVADEPVIGGDPEKRLETTGYEVAGKVMTEEEAVQTAPDFLIMEMALPGEMDVWNLCIATTALVSDERPSEQVWYRA